MKFDDPIGAEIVGAQAFPISMRYAPDRHSGAASRSDIVERIAHHANTGCLDPQELASPMQRHRIRLAPRTGVAADDRRKKWLGVDFLKGFDGKLSPFVGHQRQGHAHRFEFAQRFEGEWIRSRRRPAKIVDLVRAL
jgi:hypothetical protein